MADYSNFPFGDLTTAQISMLMMESISSHDIEFANACKDYLIHHPEKKLHGPDDCYVCGRDSHNGSYCGMPLCIDCYEKQPDAVKAKLAEFNKTRGSNV